MITEKQREDYANTFERFKQESQIDMADDEIHDILERLHRHETTLSRYNEMDCNGEELSRYQRKREENIMSEIEGIAEKLGFEVRFNSDPRGGAIRFILPSGRYNTWDGETWGIFW